MDSNFLLILSSSLEKRNYQFYDIFNERFICAEEGYKEIHESQR